MIQKSAMVLVLVLAGLAAVFVLMRRPAIAQPDPPPEVQRPERPQRPAAPQGAVSVARVRQPVPVAAGEYGVAIPLHAVANPLAPGRFQMSAWANDSYAGYFVLDTQTGKLVHVGREKIAKIPYLKK